MLTIAQAAAALGMTPSAVRVAIRQGRLTPIRLSPRVVLLETSEIERYRATPKHAGGRPKRAT